MVIDAARIKTKRELFADWTITVFTVSLQYWFCLFSKEDDNYNVDGRAHHGHGFIYRNFGEESYVCRELLAYPVGVIIDCMVVFNVFTRLIELSRWLFQEGDGSSSGKDKDTVLSGGEKVVIDTRTLEYVKRVN